MTSTCVARRSNPPSVSVFSLRCVCRCYHLPAAVAPRELTQRSVRVETTVEVPCAGCSCVSRSGLGSVSDPRRLLQPLTLRGGG